MREGTKKMDRKVRTQNSFVGKGIIYDNDKSLGCSYQDQLFNHPDCYSSSAIDDRVNRDSLLFVSSQIDKSILLQSIKEQRPIR